MQLIIIALIYVLGPFIIISLYNQFKFVRKTGTILLSYGLGIIVSFTGLMDASQTTNINISALQEWIMNITVPLAIPLLLFSADFKIWQKSMKKTVAAMIAGFISIIIAVVAGYFLFHQSNQQELWKVGGMMIGMYTGGTMNFAAISRILDINPTVFTLVSAFEMTLSLLFLLFILSGGFKLFRKLLPVHQDQPDREDGSKIDIPVEDYSGLFKKKQLGGSSIGWLLSVFMMLLGVGLSWILSGKLNELIIIFTLTTLAIMASFIKKIRTLPKTFEWGMYLINVFSVVIASQFDARTLNAGNLLLIGFIGFIIVLSTGLHLLLSRLFKVEGDLFTITHVSLLYSPPFVPPVVSAMGNRKVMISGILTGLVGYAVGTYLGVAVAGLLHLLH